MSHKTTRTHLRRAVYHTRQTLIGFAVELLWIARIQGYLLRGCVAALVQKLHRLRKRTSVVAGHPADVALTRGERAAETVARGIGSWRFIIWQNVIVLLWMTFNVIAIFGLHWDPYPFILLNLVFSWQASNTGPILQMTGNAAAKRDRALWEMMAGVLQHVEKIAEADHAEHGRLLRAVHSHVYCDGHTTIESVDQTPEQPEQPDV